MLLTSYSKQVLSSHLSRYSPVSVDVSLFVLWSFLFVLFLSAVYLFVQNSFSCDAPMSVKRHWRPPTKTCAKCLSLQLFREVKYWAEWHICWVNHLEYAYFSALAIAQDNTYSATSTDIKAGCLMYSILCTVVCTCDVVGLLQTWLTALSRGEEGFWWGPPSMLLHFIFSKELSILLLTASIFAAEISNHHWTWAPFGEEGLSLSPCATHFLRAGPARTVTLRTLLPGFLQPANLSLFWSRN